MPEINLVDFFKYYENEPQQAEVQLLQSAMPDSLLKNESAWVKKYREKPEPPQGEAVLANPLKLITTVSTTTPSGDGWRECFSSSCAMAAKYWGVIDDFNSITDAGPNSVTAPMLPRRFAPSKALACKLIL